MDSAAIEETNRLRVSLGMKPLPVPGGSGPQFKEKDAPTDPEEDPGSTLETREAAAYDNYRKVQEAEATKKKRELLRAAIKKEQDQAERFKKLEGKGLGDEDEDVDAKAWLMSQKKRQKKIDKVRKLEEQLAAAEAEAAAAVQYTSKDLAGVKVAHEVNSFEDGDEQILTLKDSEIIRENSDEEGDELENVELREREKLNEKLELKKKKPVYNPLDDDETGERSILAHYDEEIDGKKTKRFTLDAQGSSARAAAEANSEGGPGKLQRINLDFLDEVKPTSDYLDISEIKVKKPKKKKSKSTRQRPAEEDDIVPVESAPQQDDQLMDIDSGAGYARKKRKTEDTSFVDDEDLQATLNKQRRDALKKRKRMRPEDLARQLREEASQEPDGQNGADAQDGGLVIDEISEFVAGLKKDDEEERKPRRPKSTSVEPVTKMGDESDEDERMRDADEDADYDQRAKRDTSTPADLPTTGVDEEKTVGTGLGSTLQLLRERGLIKETNSADLNASFRQKQTFLAEKQRLANEWDRQTKSQRERDRTSGRLDRMSAREREEYSRQQNIQREQYISRQMASLFDKGYKPDVQLKYTDEHGRSLNQKDAFKHLSHQFHGKGSGKGKTDKRLKKIEDEKRREAQSVLDASQNVGMSSATAQQTKKRKEAGVRLA